MKPRDGDTAMASCKLYRMKDGKVGTTEVDVASFGRRSPRRVQRVDVFHWEELEPSTPVATEAW